MATPSILAGHIATRQNCGSVNKKKERMAIRQETYVLLHTEKEQIKTSNSCEEKSVENKISNTVIATPYKISFYKLISSNGPDSF